LNLFFGVAFRRIFLSNLLFETGGLLGWLAYPCFGQPDQKLESVHLKRYEETQK